MLFVPAIYVGVTAHGAIAAAVAWVAINSLGVLFAIPLLHAHLAPREKWRWLLLDVAFPTAAALGATALVRAAMPAQDTIVFALPVALAVSYAAAAAASPVVRGRVAPLVEEVSPRTGS